MKNKGVIIPLRAKLSGKLAGDPIVKESLKEQIKEAVTAPDPDPATVEEAAHSLIADMMDKARDAGIQSDDPMHAFVQAAGLLIATTADTQQVWTTQVERLIEGQKVAAEVNNAKAQAQLQTTALRLMTEIREDVSVEVGRTISRLPLAIGRMRAVIVSGLLVGALASGYAVGFHEGNSGVRSSMAVDAGAEWTPTWLNLRRWNNIDAAIAASSCFFSADGTRYCFVPLRTQEAKPPQK